jgi:hypothetical protein
MFNAADIPVPRVTHAMVELNGRDLGMFVLVEGWNKQFLKHHFADTGGNLYERVSGANEVNKRLEVKTGDTPDDRRALEALAAAAEETDLPKRWAALERTLDLDRFINGMALEIMIGHWDGYCRNQNNFRVFHDRPQNRLVFMPHGMDQLFGLKGRSFADTPLMPQMRGLVAAAIMETPEGRRRYVAALEELHARVFDVAALTNRVVETAARLHPLLLASDPAALRTNETLVASLLKRIPERHESLARQIAALKTPWLPGGRELAEMPRWESKRDSGSPNFGKQSGRLETNLQITGTGTITCIGSWRTTLLLEPGRYRFEAQVAVEETKGKTIRPEGAASLRSSEGDEGASASLPQTTTNLTHEFTVATTRYVDLICQYRGNSGKAVFDGESFSLLRLADAPRVDPPALRRGKPDNR